MMRLIFYHLLLLLLEETEVLDVYCLLLGNTPLHGRLLEVLA